MAGDIWLHADGPWLLSACHSWHEGNTSSLFAVWDQYVGKGA
jgi:hypothetical protein